MVGHVIFIVHCDFVSSLFNVQLRTSSSPHVISTHLRGMREHRRTSPQCHDASPIVSKTAVPFR